ncbi:aminoacyl-tRNA hydrolase [Clostridia bacterium]|nr:aminoacyl-tRNA hydrolase [Clostridia bacterium]
MKLIVGLGNPGKEYESTRHNMGFMALDLLAEKLGASFVEKKKHNAMVASALVDGEKLLLVKPLTFMNASGEAVRSLRDYYDVDVKDLVVLVDDLTLNPGVLRIRGKGSSGGQKGIASVIEHLGTQDFARIKMGIGKPQYGSAIPHVLGHFSDEEWDAAQQAVNRAAEAVLYLLKEGTYKAMNEYNG